MKREELKEKNLKILDDESKYIYETILNCKSVNKTKKALAKELNVSIKIITAKFIRAAYMVNHNIYEKEEKQLKRYIKKCIKDDLIQLSEIADYYHIEIEDLKAALNNYIISFTTEESIIADRFPWTEEALKKDNIQTLIYRVNGFSKNPKRSNQVLYDNVEEKDIEFLKSVKNIYKEYSLDDMLKIKTLKNR